MQNVLSLPSILFALVIGAAAGVAIGLNVAPAAARNSAPVCTPVLPGLCLSGSIANPTAPDLHSLPELTAPAH